VHMSVAAVGDGSTNNTDCEVGVGGGSISKGNSQGTLVDGNTNCPDSVVSVGYGRSHYPNSKVTVGDRSTPSTESSNLHCGGTG
jgi:hypothetical protein